MSNLTADPPVYSINGAWLLNGTIIWGTNGINLTAPPGLFTFDPKTNKSATLLNNYRGLRFATPDDLVVDQNGNILFTDAPFAYVRPLFRC
jgi:sugar lactone lactonase YvrE